MLEKRKVECPGWNFNSVKKIINKITSCTIHSHHGQLHIDSNQMRNGASNMSCTFHTGKWKNGIPGFMLSFLSQQRFSRQDLSHNPHVSRIPITLRAYRRMIPKDLAWRLSHRSITSNPHFGISVIQEVSFFLVQSATTIDTIFFTGNLHMTNSWKKCFGWSSKSLVW